MTRSGFQVIERHITFNVHADKSEAFERFVADEYAPAMSRAPGFVRIDLLREAGSATRYMLAFRFEDAERAAAWRTSTVHEELQPALETLVGEREVQAYDVIA